MKLRPYQAKAVRQITTSLKEGRRPLCYAPTGGGKTEIAAGVFLKAFQMGARKLLFVVHTRVLHTQTVARLAGYGVDVVTISALLLAPDLYKDAQLVCFDEAHHLQGSEWRNAVALFDPGCGIFGLSATPYVSMLAELFDERIIAATVQSLVKGGFMVPVQFKKRSDAFVMGMAPGDKIDGALGYAAHYLGKQAIHFEPEIELCETAAAKYTELGISCGVVHQKTSPVIRDTLIRRFRDSEIQVLISPVLLAEGFDAPCAEVVIAGRAFKSDILLQQAVGRVRRMHPGKTMAYLLDCTGCCDGRSPEYFNTTDDSLFCALPSPEEAAAATGAGTGRPRTAVTINWVECKDWEDHSPDLTAIMQRAEYADALDVLRDEVQGRAKALTEAQQGAKKKLEREAARRRYLDPTVREQRNARDRERRAKKSKQKLSPEQREEKRRIAKREQYLRAVSNPESKVRMLEAKAKYLSNPENVEKQRKYAREYHRRRYAAKKAALISEKLAKETNG